jgi:hypothetical protein
VIWYNVSGIFALHHRRLGLAPGVVSPHSLAITSPAFALTIFTHNGILLSLGVTMRATVISFYPNLPAPFMRGIIFFALNRDSFALQFPAFTTKSHRAGARANVLAATLKAVARSD